MSMPCGDLDVSYKRAGLWHGFSVISQTLELSYAAGSSQQKRTFYSYDPIYQYGFKNGVEGQYQYGNAGRVEEYDSSNTLIRRTDTYWYIVDAPVRYLVDRQDRVITYDGQGRYLTRNLYMYDNQSTKGVPPDKGRLTRLQQNTNLPLQTSITDVTLQVLDTTYGYDDYGNRREVRSYPAYGWSLLNSAWNFSAPGDGSSPRITTTHYDPLFHTFPMTVTNTLGHIERAIYDERMGTLIKVAGPNVASFADVKAFDCGSANVQIEITCASYDRFGRLATIVRPGDTVRNPTLMAIYDDNALPFKYIYSQKVTATSGSTTQEFVQFYDGLGRKVQDKRELGGNAMAVTDTRSDGLNRVVASSQPRSDGATWDSYVPAPAAGTPLYRETKTSYDALGRSLQVTAPDNSVTRTTFTMGSIGLIAQQYDAKNHLITHESDSLGRLRVVREYRGNAGSEGAYVLDATTSYSYDPIDRLVLVGDAKLNSTTISYDSVGRKTSMSDPDMGAWSYVYDVNGTLHSQTDARNVTTVFSYDAIDRLTGKTYSNGENPRSYSYDSTNTNTGIGQRTGSCVWSGSTCLLAMEWFYDGRNRQTKIHQTTPAKQLIYKMSYDSADRLLTQTYPGGEVVTTDYDVAGRALSLCSSLGMCYVDNSTNSSVYTALDQPVTRKLGNGLTTTWTYNSPLAQIERMTTPGVFDRRYSYDPAGNVGTIRNYSNNQTQNFSYDHRDRLTRAWTVVGTAQAPSSPIQHAQAQSQDVLTYDLGASSEAAPVKVAHGYARLPQRTLAPAPQQQSAITLVQDSFTRTVSNGWGTATQGGSYAAPGSNAADYSVNGSVGRMAVATAGTARELLLNGAGTRSAQDVESSARIATSALPVSGGEMRFILMTRVVASGTNYHGLVRITPSGQVKVEVRRNEGGTETTLGSAVTVSGLTASANSYLRVRVQAAGTNPTTVKLRVWKDGSSEPTTWQVSQTDSTAMLQQAGVLGLRTQLSSGATNAPITGSWDDWQVTILASDPSLALAPSYDDSYSYDTIGNLTSKDGITQQYGANGDGTGAGPHQARTVGGAAYGYDANGNLLSGGGRTLTWNAENQPTQIVSGSVTESYSYDADGARVTRSATPGLSTRYAFGLYEVEGAITRSYYALGGQMIAVRDSGLGLSYLYGDHLSSISASTSATGQVQGVQHFDAWGQRLTGSVPQTKRSYTGQYLDDTGLLFYNARYYDARIGRFVSADTIVPSAGSLTVTPNDAVAAKAWGTAGAAANPQELNRYSYVNNNPIGAGDPTGHKRPDDPARSSHGKCNLAVCGEEGVGAAPGGGGGWGPLGGDEGDRRAVDAAKKPLPRKGGDGATQTTYATGNSQSQGPKARPSDVEMDANGNVVPGKGGASSSETPAQIPTRGYVYQKTVHSDDPDIRYTPNGGMPDGRGGVHPDGHVSAIPVRSQSFESYKDAYERGWELMRDSLTGKGIIGPNGK